MSCLAANVCLFSVAKKIVFPQRSGVAVRERASERVREGARRPPFLSFIYFLSFGGEE